MNYSILADPIRGWMFDDKNKRVKKNCERKSGLTRIKKYRKILKFHKINFTEVFIPAGYDTRDILKELHEELSKYPPCQDLYVFIF